MVNHKYFENNSNFNSKLIYNSQRFHIDYPKSFQYWNSKLDHNINWDEVYHVSHFSYAKPKVKEFHWKSLNNVIYTEKKLKQFQKSNGLCKICKIKDEDIVHLLYECKYPKYLWQHIEILLQNIIDQTFKISKNTAILGIDKHVANSDFQSFLNMIICTAKWTIWKIRNDIKFNNSKIDLYNSKTKVKKDLTDILELISLSRNYEKYSPKYITCLSKCCKHIENW